MPTKQTHEKHPKQGFQVERLAFFSDAVFAIIITLLAIEFKSPHVVRNSTFESVLEQVYELKFHFISLVLTYLLIANLWVKHHLLFKHLNDYNRQIVIVNLICLFPVLFFPFTTSFVADSIDSNNNRVILLSLQLYILNTAIAFLSTYFLYRSALVKYEALSYKMEDSERIIFVSKTLYASILSLAVLLVSLLIDNYQVLVLVFFPGILALNLIKNYRLKKIAYRKKANK